MEIYSGHFVQRLSVSHKILLTQKQITLWFQFIAKLFSIKSKK